MLIWGIDDEKIGPGVAPKIGLKYCQKCLVGKRIWTRKYDVLMLNRVLFLVPFVTRRRLGRKRDLGKVSIAFGSPLGLDLRLLGKPSKVLGA